VRRPHEWTLLVLLLAAPPCFAATKDADRPDREMLRIMEFLREIEMLKQMELMRDMQEVEHAGDKPPNGTAQKSLPGKKKEATK
jgi:hypothetical protein